MTAPWGPGDRSGGRRSNTTVISSLACDAYRSSSSMSLRTALSGSFHQRSGREPMTFIPSTIRRTPREGRAPSPRPSRSSITSAGKYPSDLGESRRGVAFRGLGRDPIGGLLHPSKPTEDGEGQDGCEAPDHEADRNGPLLRQVSEPRLPSNASETPHEGVERHQRGPLRGRDGLVEVGLTNRLEDPSGHRAKKEHRYGEPEIANDPCLNHGRGRNCGRPEQDRGPPPARPSQLPNQRVARDAGQCEQRGDQTGQPDGVLSVQLKEVRLPRVPGPREEAPGYERLNNEEPNGRLPPPVRDAGASD